jgi:hypothetical protein
LAPFRHAGQGGLCFEPGDASGLADQFGRGQLCTPRKSQQRRRKLMDTITGALAQRI